MITNIKEPFPKKKGQGKSTHDGLIRSNARNAAKMGASEDSNPYTYDLRARTIWLKAFKAERKRNDKASAKD